MSSYKNFALIEASRKALDGPCRRRLRIYHRKFVGVSCEHVKVETSGFLALLRSICDRISCDTCSVLEKREIQRTI